MALVSGIEESKIIEIRNEHVYDEATRSVQKHGWLPGLFRGIIQKAKEILQVLIRETEIPPKPTLSVDMAEYRTMQKLMVKVQDEARAIKQLMHGELPKLEKQLIVYFIRRQRNRTLRAGTPCFLYLFFCREQAQLP